MMIQRIIWSVRREFWENKTLYLAPLILALVFLIGFAISAVHLPEQLRALDSVKQRAALILPYDLAEALLMLTGMIVGGFYCVDALYGERRDRSILLWKSMPVSDAFTVAVKASIPILVMPVLIFVVIVVLQALISLLISGALMSSGQQALSGQFSIVGNLAPLFFHLIAVHGISQAPFYAWLLLISARAPRAPFVWAVMPPVAIAFVEKITLGSTRFGDLLQSWVTGASSSAASTSGRLMEPMTKADAFNFVSAPNFWIRVAITLLFLGAAERIRRAARVL